VLTAGAAALAAPAVPASAAPAVPASAASAQERPFRAAAGIERPARPNVLFIFADDLGWADLSCYGSPDIRTPHLDTVAAHAAAYITGHRERPWLLNLNFTAPHWPWEAPGDQDVSKDLTARIKAGEPGALQHADGGSLGTYHRMVEAMDAGIGRVLQALTDSGQRDNTLVIFSSDNGGERWSYQWPLSGSRCSPRRRACSVCRTTRLRRRFRRRCGVPRRANPIRSSTTDCSALAYSPRWPSSCSGCWRGRCGVARGGPPFCSRPPPG
jgi:hypothetical protein